MKKIHVEIDRAHWRTGGRSYDNLYGETLLKNSQGYMCCLGFIGEVLGHDLSGGKPCPANTIRVPAKNTLDPDKEHWPELTEDDEGTVQDSGLAAEAMELNDEDEIDNEEREDRILTLFEDTTYALEFVGAYPEREGEDE